MGETFVVLGAGVAGMALTHHLIKHTAQMVEGLKVILVTPNTDQ